MAAQSWDFSHCLRFLVLDEADRLLQQGSLPQLIKIFNAIHQREEEDNESEESEEEEEDEEDDDDRLLGLPGVPGEAALVTLEDLQKQQEMALSHAEKKKVVFNTPRQTFIYSATLTVSTSNQKNPVEEIMKLAHVQGKVKVIDLTTTTSTNTTFTTAQKKEPKKLQKLPPGLTLKEIRCTQGHKDSHLYAYLLASRGKSVLVFCNSIAAVKRVTLLLAALQLQVSCLHAQISQVRRRTALRTMMNYFIQRFPEQKIAMWALVNNL